MSIYNIKSMTLNYDGGLTSTVQLRRDRNTVYYDDFSTIYDLQFNDRAAVLSQPVLSGEDYALRICDSGSNRKGSIFYTKPLTVAQFSTHFRFRIHTNVNGGADGIVFTIADSPFAIGGQGGGIGYSNITPSVGVELDTWNNGASIDGNNANHIGINLNGSITSVARFNLTETLQDGSIWNCWVDYNGTTLRTSAAIGSKPSTPQLEYNVDIPSVMGSGTAYFGWTSATATAWSHHDLLSWTFA